MAGWQLVVRMLAQSVGVGGGRAVAQLRAVGSNDPTEPGGSATIQINDPDALDTIEEGAYYNVSITQAEPPVEAEPAPVEEAAEAEAAPEAAPEPAPEAAPAPAATSATTTAANKPRSR